MNSTGNYHIQVKYFLENNGFSGRIFMVDARRTEHLRKVMNLGKEKSDPEDAHILASVPWRDITYRERWNHIRNEPFELIRMREVITANVTRIVNYITADLEVVFPEFTDLVVIVSKKGMEILENFITLDNISSLSKGKLLDLKKKEGGNHYGVEDTERLIDSAKNSIDVPEKQGVFTFRISMNVYRLRNEMVALNNVEREAEIMPEENSDVECLIEMKGIGKMNTFTIVSR